MTSKTILRVAAAILVVAAGAAAAEEPAATVSGAATSADGAAIAYEAAGSGSPALVFVHGWSCDRGYWSRQMAHFAAGHRVVAIDLAGHGASPAAREDYTMTAFGADVVAVLEKLDIDDAVLVGHSMGGAVIVEAALAAPGRVRGLVGVDNFQNVAMKMDPRMVDGFVGTFEGDFPARVDGWVRQMFPATADSALVAAVASDMASAPPEVGLSALRNLLDWYLGGNAPARLEKLDAPLICINSDGEETNVEAIKAVVPGYRLHLMAGRGHFLMREDPDGFDALLARVVEEITAP